MKDVFGSGPGKVQEMLDRMTLPVICAPMFLISGPEMVVAACKAGIMGAFPATNARSIDQLRIWLSKISNDVSVDDAPWAMNLITHSSYGRFEEELDLVEQFQPDLVVTALGGPSQVVDRVHGYGGMVFADVNSPRYARKAIEKGADGLVLVCSGAGGHTGEYAMLPFVEEVRGFFEGPLIVGGGIGTGQAVRAVELLGADFAYLGTRFLAASESMIADEYRQMVWDSRMEDLVTSRAITGALGNWMRASVEAAGLSTDDMAATAKIDFSDDMHSGSKAWKHVWSAGQGVGSINQSETVAQAVAALRKGYSAAVEREAKGSRFARRAPDG